MNLNLEMQVSQTQVGLYTVTYCYKKAPLDVQEAAFAEIGLSIISPAQLGFLRAKEGRDTFNPYSRTGADVFYDDRIDQAVIVPDRAISRLVSTANLVNASGRRRECVIPKNQRGLVYARVDEMLDSGIAFIVPDRNQRVKTSEFGKYDLTSRLFSDKSLGIEAQEYGDWQQSQGRNVIQFSMDSWGYSRAQEVPYLNRLRIFGPAQDFMVVCSGWSIGNFGAFGVRFEKTVEELGSPHIKPQIGL